MQYVHDGLVACRAGAEYLQELGRLIPHCNIVGIVVLQNSFHSARAIIAMPLSGALSNIAPIVGGIVVFGERLPAGPTAAAMRVGAFLLTIAAGALLAGSREQTSAEPTAARAALAIKN